MKGFCLSLSGVCCGWLKSDDTCRLENEKKMAIHVEHFFVARWMRHRVLGGQFGFSGDGRILAELWFRGDGACSMQRLTILLVNSSMGVGKGGDFVIGPRYTCCIFSVELAMKCCRWLCWQGELVHVNTMGHMCNYIGTSCSCGWGKKIEKAQVSEQAIKDAVQSIVAKSRLNGIEWPPHFAIQLSRAVQAEWTLIISIFINDHVS